MPWVTVKDLSDERVALSTAQEWITEEGLKRSAARLVPAGVPIICTRMAVGRVGMPERCVAINQDLKALYPASGVEARYLILVLQRLRPRLEGIATGSTVKGLPLEHLLAQEVLVPTLPIQRKILDSLDVVDESIRQTEAHLAKLRRVKTGLMQDLLTGRVSTDALRQTQGTALLPDAAEAT